MELSVSLKMVSSENGGHFDLDDEFVDSILGYAISTLARSFERFVVKTSEQTKNHEIIKRQKGRY